MNTPIKIQINSLDALERLIGNDTTLEIEVRNSIVQEFTKKHLKALAEESVIKASEKSVMNYLKTEYLTEQRKGYYGTELILKNPISDVIKNNVNTIVLGEIDRIISTKVMVPELEKKILVKFSEIDKLIDERLGYLTDGVINNYIENKANQKIKDKLGI